MNETRVNKKDKNQHIQVFVRVRPTNNAERAGKSSTVVDVASNKEIVVRERPQDKSTKKFTFDRVFGPDSKQLDVYNSVVSPLLDEVLAGYNCTVFAYGQTGTGKTFTMEGAGNDPSLHWQSNTQAGIIPRSLSHLFDELRTLDAQEYTVRVSFLELYNEELFDLLSPTDDASKIRLYEDASRKGAVIIHGLEEVTVHNKSEVYKILEKGSEKRQTAATLMNANSSRSHTVFSITVHIKENTVDGEELLKTGKLNLVDLAGSENVGRSGAVDRRAREAGSINQSLLTLGRVITALVERAPHIPYRESKLTRLLQESLGGRTKTSIIATVSPASINLEETLSTLDYAHRAKNITNRPEINQKLSKKALLKEYTEEIERLRRDLLATRERNGVYLAQENYNEMQSTIDSQGKDIEEKINHIKALEEKMFDKEKLFTNLQTELEERTIILNETKVQLESTKNVLTTTKSCLQTTKLDRDVNKHLLEKHANTEKILYSQAETLLKVADTATDDTYKLHDKIVRKKRVEDENENLGQQFRHNIANRFELMEHDLSTYSRNLVQFCMSMKDQILAQTAVNGKGIDTTIQLSKDLATEERVEVGTLENKFNASCEDYKKWIEEQASEASAMTDHRSSVLLETLENLAPRIKQLVDNKIAANLRLVNERTARNLENLSTHVKDSTATFCERLLANQQRLFESMSEMQETINESARTHNEASKRRKDFFESLWSQYRNLDAAEERSNTIITDAMVRATQICNNVTKESTDSCENEAANKRIFAGEVETSIDTVKRDIAAEMEKNWKVADESIEQSKILVHEFQKGIQANCDSLNTYNNLVQRNARGMREKIDTDRDSIVSSTDKLGKIISNASANHAEIVEEQRRKAESSFAEIAHKCEDQGVESTEWNNRITAQLRTTRHQVDKFVVEDMRRDAPTGLTPAKREFQYPRKLITTSPHERIIKRFREMRKQSEGSDEEQDTTLVCTDAPLIKRQSGNTGGRIASPTSAIKQRSTSTPYNEAKTKFLDCNNTATCNPLIRSASTSDLLLSSGSSFDVSTRSESEVYITNDNKENGVEAFVKPVRKILTKRASREKPQSRRILGNYN